MHQFIQVQSREQAGRFCAMRGLSPLNPETLARHQADAHWMVSDEAGEIAARCSLWWTVTPPFPGERLGLIGHYAVLSASAASAILQHACEQMAERGSTLAIGPMDGNTWQRYRLLTERGHESIFFLEPDNPDDWPAHFYENGFADLAHYSSAVNTDLSQRDPRLEGVAQRMSATGVKIRALRNEHFTDELARIYAISETGFRHNFLYTPISQADFIAQYEPVKPYVRPELVLIAECENQPVGFIFAVPDILQAKRGQAIDTIIIKTVAVLPGRDHAGLGSLLVARCQETAEQLGYQRAIHALMHDGNNSRNISHHYARTIRRYTLFSRRLVDQA